MNHLIKRLAIIAFLAIFTGFLMGGISRAETPEEFYRGKTIAWVVSIEAGSPGDLMARTIATFLGKEIGAKVRVENRKTDEGINYLYKQKGESLIMGLESADSIIYNEILKAPGVRYETDKLNFLADVYPTVKILMISPKLPYKTLDDLRKAKGLRGGATSTKGSMAVSSAVMLEILGLDGKIITGYNGKKSVILALARGEADFVVVSDSSSVRDEKAGYVVNIMTIGDQRSVAVPHIPSLLDLGVKVPKELESIHKLIIAAGTAVFMPPGVPPERVEYLRKVFQDLNNNKELQVAKAKLTGISVPFLPGKEVQQAMAEIKADKGLVPKLDAIFKKYTAVR